MIQLSKCIQMNEVNSEYEALFSVIHPILYGLVMSLKQDIVSQIGGYKNMSLGMFTRMYVPGDGDCGICFEYAVHNAIISKNSDVLNRIDDALTKYCKIKGTDPSSILSGAEKSGQVQFIDSVMEHLTDDSLLLTGKKGQPIKLKKHINGVAAAFRKPKEREKLPSSINGLWKADLFVGNTLQDKWVGTTVKINPSQLESARGLRLGIVPSRQGKSDKIIQHETKNLIICPVPYDYSFMEIFYEGWDIVKQFINAKSEMPKEINLPGSLDRTVCKHLVDRKNYNVLDVIEYLKSMAQPHLLDVANESANIDSTVTDKKISVNRIVAPISSLMY